MVGQTVTIKRTGKRGHCISVGMHGGLRKYLVEVEETGKREWFIGLELEVFFEEDSEDE